MATLSTDFIVQNDCFHKCLKLYSKKFLRYVVLLWCMVGMTKIKMSSEEAGSLEFVERRRAALERLFLVIII